MSMLVTNPGGPLRWKAAGILAAHLPNVRGHDRVVGLVHGRAGYSGPVSGRLHNGLEFAFPDASDGSVRSMMALRYREPVLAPVLRAALGPGDCFYDVGANLGIYTLWAAPLVGAGGQVHAFEPAPETRDGLARLVRRNRLENVSVVPAAVGAEDYVGYLQTVPHASGLAYLSDDKDGCTETTVISLDAYAREHRPPTLIKIDIEGHELAAIRGARDLLGTRHPAVVFELISSHQARAGTPDAAIVDEFAALGYEIFNLMPRGLRPATGGSFTVNVLALSSRNSGHSAVARKLEKTRFSRNHTT